MARAVFSAMGAIMFCCVAMVLLVLFLSAGHSSGHVPPLTFPIFGRLFFLAVALSVLGLGLIGLRKWAALAFSLCTLYMSFWVFAESLHSVPWSWSGIGFWWGLLLVSPSVLTLIFWHSLVWRARKFEKDGVSSAD